MAAIVTPEDKLLAKYEERFAACQQARTLYEKQWYTNLAMYFGRHWTTWTPKIIGDSQVYVLREPASSRWRVRSVTNKIKPTIRNELTKLTKEEPQFYVVPSSTEEKDIAAARAGEAIADFLLHNNDFNRVRSLATFWTLICGTSFLKTWYDPDKMELDQQPGKITFDAVTPFHLYVPYLQEVFLEDQPYLFHARAMDPELVSDKYGKDVDADTEVSGGQLDQRLSSALGIKTDKNKQIKQVYIKEVWVKPCKDFPGGAMFVMGNKKLLYIYEGLQSAPVGGNLPVVGELVSDYPYEHNCYPFQKIDHIPTGRFYGQSVIEDLIPLQKEYNRTRSQMIEAKNRTSKPQFVVTKGSVNPNKITSEPGLIIEVNPGFDPPRPLENPELPAYVPNELSVISTDWDHISGQYEVTQGRTPPGVEAASAIAYLQEENDTRLFHTVQSVEAAVQESGRQALALAHQFWDEPRTIRVASANNIYETMQFKGSDLGGLLDLRVETGSMAPKSRAAKQAFITDLMKNGFIPPQMGLKYLQMSETNRLHQELQLDARQAQRENYRMSQGMVNNRNPWDNDIAHKIEHESFMKTQEFEMLPEEIKAMFLMHLDQHNQQMAMEMQAQQEIDSPPEEELEETQSG